MAGHSTGNFKLISRNSWHSQDISLWLLRKKIHIQLQSDLSHSGFYFQIRNPWRAAWRKSLPGVVFKSFKTINLLRIPNNICIVPYSLQNVFTYTTYVTLTWNAHNNDNHEHLRILTSAEYGTRHCTCFISFNPLNKPTYQLNPLTIPRVKRRKQA